MNINLQFPAISGDVVTEAHAAICTERGHATHTVDGVESDLCPRCGADKTAPADAEVFASIVKLEESVRNTKWSVRAAASGLISSAYRGGVAADKMAADTETLAAKLKRDQDRLFGMVDALTPAQRAAFGEYRKN